MARVKNGAVTKARHKKVLKQAKGYFGSKHRLYKSAKREFRKLWITRINAACRENGISYSRFIEGLNKAGVEVNRKMLSEIAINDPKAFTELVEVAKKGKEGKIKATEVKTTSEVTVKSSDSKAKEDTKTTEKKATAKKETKKEEKAEVKDFSKMTVAELKEIAKEKGISTTGLKKADIIAALEK